jgi:hypothetical protein
VTLPPIGAGEWVENPDQTKASPWSLDVPVRRVGPTGDTRNKGAGLASLALFIFVMLNHSALDHASCTQVSTVLPVVDEREANHVNI